MGFIDGVKGADASQGKTVQTPKGHYFVITKETYEPVLSPSPDPVSMIES